MPYDATQTFGGYDSGSSSTFNSGTFDSTKPFGGYEVDKDLPNIWDFPGALKPGEKESPANPANKGKNFLDAFTKGLGDLNKNKYQDQAQQGGFQTGGKGDTSGASVGKIAPDVSIYTPPTPYAPFTVQGMQGKKGMGGALGGLAGTALGFALAPLTAGTSLALTAAEGAALGGGLGSGIGGMFG
jgi:hypothetical protein